MLRCPASVGARKASPYSAATPMTRTASPSGCSARCATSGQLPSTSSELHARPLIEPCRCRSPALPRSHQRTPAVAAVSHPSAAPKKMTPTKKQFLTTWALLTTAGLGMLGMGWLDWIKTNDRDWWNHFYLAVGVIVLAPVFAWFNSRPPLPQKEPRLDPRLRFALVVGAYGLVALALLLTAPLVPESWVGYFHIASFLLILSVVMILLTELVAWTWKGLKRHFR